MSSVSSASSVQNLLLSVETSSKAKTQVGEREPAPRSVSIVLDVGRPGLRISALLFPSIMKYLTLRDSNSLLSTFFKSRKIRTPEARLAYSRECRGYFSQRQKLLLSVETKPKVKTQAGEREPAPRSVSVVSDPGLPGLRITAPLLPSIMRYLTLRDSSSLLSIFFKNRKMHTPEARRTYSSECRGYFLQRHKLLPSSISDKEILNLSLSLSPKEVKELFPFLPDKIIKELFPSLANEEIAQLFLPPPAGQPAAVARQQSLPLFPHATHLDLSHISSRGELLKVCALVKVHAPNIQVITSPPLAIMESAHDGHLQVLVESCPNLRDFTWKNSRFTNEGIKLLVRKCRYLEKLNLAGSKSMSDEGLLALADCLHLRVLNLEDVDTITGHGLVTLGTRGIRLTYLNVNGCQNILGDAIVTFVGRQPQLQELYMERCGITDAHLEAIAQSCVDLRVVYFASHRCPTPVNGPCPSHYRGSQTTDRGLLALATHCKNLCSVSFNYYNKTEKGLILFVQKCGRNLIALELPEREIKYLSTDFFLALSESCPYLQSFTDRGDDLDDEKLRAFAGKAPRLALRQLDLQYNLGRITVASILAITDKSPAFERLDMIGSGMSEFVGVSNAFWEIIAHCAHVVYLRSHSGHVYLEKEFHWNFSSAIAARPIIAAQKIRKEEAERQAKAQEAREIAEAKALEIREITEAIALEVIAIAGTAVDIAEAKAQKARGIVEEEEEPRVLSLLDLAEADYRSHRLERRRALRRSAAAGTPPPIIDDAYRASQATFIRLSTAYRGDMFHAPSSSWVGFSRAPLTQIAEPIHAVAEEPRAYAVEAFAALLPQPSPTPAPASRPAPAHAERRGFQDNAAPDRLSLRTPDSVPSWVERKAAGFPSKEQREGKRT